LAKKTPEEVHGEDVEDTLDTGESSEISWVMDDSHVRSLAVVSSGNNSAEVEVSISSMLMFKHQWLSSRNNIVDKDFFARGNLILD
jgi:hypothetical protein